MRNQQSVFGIYRSELINNTWTPQSPIPGIGSTDGPALATMPQDATSTGLMMAWKGVEDDSGIYLSTKGFGDWSPQRRIDGVGTSNRPALCNFGSMRMVWTGIEDDSGIYFSLFDGNEFTGQVRVNNVGTSRVPSVFTVGASPT